jgi:hypothetical protein
VGVSPDNAKEQPQSAGFLAANMGTIFSQELCIQRADVLLVRLLCGRQQASWSMTPYQLRMQHYHHHPHQQQNNASPTSLIYRQRVYISFPLHGYGKIEKRKMKKRLRMCPDLLHMPRWNGTEEQPFKTIP